MKTIRPICADDCRLLLSWRNHPDIRRWCFDERIIDPLAHEAWFKALLADKNRIAFMLVDDGLPVAHIRFDPWRRPGQYTISIMVSPQCIGRGYGQYLLEQSLVHEELSQRAVMVRAEVFQNNQKALKLFERSGFKQTGKGCQNGHAFIEWRRPISLLFLEYPIGIVGEGPLLSAVTEILEAFKIPLCFVVQSETFSQNLSIDDEIEASSALSVHLQDQALATKVRSLFVFDWPKRIPTELLSHFPDGVYVFRRTDGSSEAFLDIQQNIYEYYGIDASNVAGFFCDILADLVFKSRNRKYSE